MSRIVIVSGGTATNELVPLFSRLPAPVTYVLPILDNGGSTSEIIRVIGGPAIGDIRLRLTRLIPPHSEPLRQLLSFRLDSDAKVARSQWNEIVEGTHPLWNDIPLSTKEILRAFFVHVHVELLKRSRINVSMLTSRQFRFELANVGNLFLTGMRIFIGSLDSAIELFMKITGIELDTEVLPCINTNFSYHIGAVLANDVVITGQSQISHPLVSDMYPPPISKTRPPSPTHELAGMDLGTLRVQMDDTPESGVSSDEEVGNVPLYMHPELKKLQLHFNKSENIEPLLSPIRRVFYVSPYGEEICPTAQSRVVTRFSSASTVVFSIGSLMTSLVPVILLKGVGRAIAHSSKKRVLLLNGCEDRETHGLRAVDYVRVIVELAQYSISKSGSEPVGSWRSFVTHVVYMEQPKIHVDLDAFEKLGILCIEVKRDQGDRFDMADLERVLLDITSA